MNIILERRLKKARWAVVVVPVVSFLLALVFGALLLLAFGIDPIQAYRVMVNGSLGDQYALTETLVKSIPLALTGLAVAIAFRMLFWNIGAEGQLAMGGIGASYVALFLSDTIPDPLTIPLMVLVGMAAGAVWALIPALLKAYLEVNEILTTLMMNYIAILMVEYLYLGPWRDPEGYGFPGSAPFPEEALLPRLWGRVHVGIIFAIVAAFIIWLIMSRSQWGYEIRLIGENPRAAKYAGIDAKRNMVLVMLLSGALSGLAGMAEVSGIARRLYQGLTVGYGFTAIIVAWMASLNPWGVVFVAAFMGALTVGGDQLQVAMGIPAAVSSVLQGAILFFVLGGWVFINYRIRIIRSGGERQTGELDE